MTTCSTKGCFAERQDGDSLFCSDCREAWRKFAKLSGLDEYAKAELWSTVDENLEYFKTTFLVGTK